MDMQIITSDRQVDTQITLDLAFKLYPFSLLSSLGGGTT